MMSEAAKIGNSFRCAGAGVVRLVRTQRNARIHLLGTVAVVGAGVLSGLSRTEWCLLLPAFTCVWLAEAMNTALEILADRVSTAPDPLIGAAKDVAAGAVLLAALGAVVTGLLVFYPHWFP